MTKKLTKPKSATKTIRVIAVDGDAVRKLMGYTIREARTKRGLTQDQCCVILGVGRAQLANIELGRSFLSAESLVHAIVNFDLTLNAEFFGAKP
jgi:transcriptional regulator with XRE-family HTH domain